MLVRTRPKASGSSSRFQGGGVTGKGQDRDEIKTRQGQERDKTRKRQGQDKRGGRVRNGGGYGFWWRGVGVREVKGVLGRDKGMVRDM